MTKTNPAETLQQFPPQGLTLSEGAIDELARLGIGPSAKSADLAAGVRRLLDRPIVPRRKITSLDILNEAYDYELPSSFSRGLNVTLPGVDLLLLSGTASIDDEGATVHVGDFEAQCARTFRNLTRLLAAENASWHDVVRTSCYLRDIERDYDTFNRMRTFLFSSFGLDPLPASTGIQARLCRSDLLIEIELMAVVPRRS